MSWFKGRNDSGETSAKSGEDRSTTSSSDTLSPAARSFDDARRALRASINLENDQEKTVSLAEKTQTSPIPKAQSESIDTIASETAEVASPIKKETEPKAEEPKAEDPNLSDITEKNEPEDDFPPLVDPKRAEDIQSILSKIGQVSVEANKTDEDTPPPPAFNVRPLGESNVETTKTIIVDQAEEALAPEPVVPSPPIPPMGSMSDPTLGKAEPIPASLSNAIKEAAPQVQENEIPEFLHESINKATSDPLEPEQEKQELEAAKPDSDPDKDIEPLISDHHIDNELSTPTPEPEVLPVAPEKKEEENTVDQVSNYNAPSSDETLLDEILETEAPKPRARVISDEPGLEIHNLGKTYKKTPVLKDVSLNVKRGEAVGLLGPNGAGKTTCFYMVCGLIPADFGSISLDGQDITELPMYRRARMGIGYLPQEASIFRGLTVAQNVRAVLEGVEKNRDKREAMLDSLLDEFSISHLRRSAAVALSGGERRRLEIARALASQPHFILLDEPLAGIDPIAVRDIRELVSHLKDRGLGVLITDHNVRETLGIVDRAYILHEGRVLMEGVPDDIIRNQEVRRVYLGDEFSR